jgi:hypothetical protein
MPANPYDVKLTQDPAGTPVEIGIMLSKPKGEQKQYAITEIDSGEEKDWIQTDFRGGMVGDTELQSGTNQYSTGKNFIAEPRTGHLFSGPNFEEASTVGAAALTTFGGCSHDGVSLVQTYLVNNYDLYVSDIDGDAFTQSLDGSSSVPVRSVASYAGNVLAAFDSAGPYKYSTDDGVLANWVTATVTQHHFTFFVPAGDVLWGLESPNTMRWTTDPTNAGTWSGAFYVGEAANNDGFVGGFFISQMLIIVKNGGIYVIDDGGNVQKVVNAQAIRGAVTDWTSKIYFNDSHSDVWEYDIWQGQLRNLHFKRALEGNQLIGGAVVGGKTLERSADKVFTATSKGLYQWSQFRDQNGNLIAEGWENLYYDDDLANLGGCVVSGHRIVDYSSGGARFAYPVYIGGSTTATKMGYVRARRTDDFDTVASLTYSTEASVFTSGIIDHGDPNTRKMEQYIEVELGGVTPNVQLAISVDGAAFANLGSAITATGKTLVEFASGTEAYKIQIRLTNTPASNVKYLVIKSIRLRATMNPSFRRRVQINARIADGITIRSGAPCPLKGDTIRTRLQTARTTAARLLLEDFMGNSFDVVIMPPLVEVPSRDEAASDTESEIQFAAIEYGVATAT